MAGAGPEDTPLQVPVVSVGQQAGMSLERHHETNHCPSARKTLSCQRLIATLMLLYKTTQHDHDRLKKLLAGLP